MIMETSHTHFICNPKCMTGYIINSYDSPIPCPSQSESEDCLHVCILCVKDMFCFSPQVKRSFGLCHLQVTYFDEENEEVRKRLCSLLLVLLFYNVIIA